MINPSPRLDQFERRYARQAWRNQSFPDALERFTALWVHAQRLNPDLGRDWAHDLASDCAVARAVNGLPPIAPA